MRFVALKSEAQLDMQTLHRVRDRLVGERTALMNQIRSILLERGHVVPQGRAKLAGFLTSLLKAEEGVILTPRMQALVADVRERWHSTSASTRSMPSSPSKPARMRQHAG